MKCKFEWYGMPCTPILCNFVYCEHNANRVFTVEEELRRSSGKCEEMKEEHFIDLENIDSMISCSHDGEEWKCVFRVREEQRSEV